MCIELIQSDNDRLVPLPELLHGHELAEVAESYGASKEGNSKKQGTNVRKQGTNVRNQI